MKTYMTRCHLNKKKGVWGVSGRGLVVVLEVSLGCLGDVVGGVLGGVWGVSCHCQLDDQYRNPNINNKDHLVVQLTIMDAEPLKLYQELISISSNSFFPALNI